MTAAAFRLACVQTCSTGDMAANLAAAADLVRRARARGAQLIALPEVVALIEPDRRRLSAQAEPERRHPALRAFRELAVETGAWLLVGSLTVDAGGGRLANRSFLLGTRGEIVAAYDKIHMFDVDLPDGESYRESETYRPGDSACLARLPWGGLGMTICYDVRFPGLYRSLARAGADFIAVPSAFTPRTGAAHWSVLLRARAIETGCYVFAPAQCGRNGPGRRTYGHSMIVDPWGRVMVELGEEVGIAVADVDPAQVREARRAIPASTHDRRYAAPSSLRAVAESPAGALTAQIR